jgi:hypothetical protein
LSRRQKWWIHEWQKNLFVIYHWLSYGNIPALSFALNKTQYRRRTDRILAIRVIMWKSKKLALTNLEDVSWYIRNDSRTMFNHIP